MASVMAIVASPRAGNSAFLVDLILQELSRRGTRCSRAVLAEHKIAPCAGHEECGRLAACTLRDDAPGLLDEFFGADGLVLASPVYFENVSGPMKTFMDRTCWHYEHGFRLRAKAAGLIAVAESSGLRDTLDAMRRYLALIGDVPCFDAAGYALMPDEARTNAGLVESVVQLAEDMAAAMGLPDPSSDRP